MKRNQRSIAELLGVHEGVVSRRLHCIRETFHKEVSSYLAQRGWSGDDLTPFIQTGLYGLLLDHPHLSHDYISRLMNARDLRLAP